MVALGNICCGTDEAGLKRKQLAADAGVIHAIISGMQEHVSVSAVQANGSAVLGNIASNIDEPGLARKDAATSAGAFAAIVAGMKAHSAGECPDRHIVPPCCTWPTHLALALATDATVQDFGCFAIGNLCRARGDTDDESAMAKADARKQLAVSQGALDAVVAAMKAHTGDEGIQEHGARALR